MTTCTADSLSTEDFDFLAKLVLDRSAIVLEPSKSYLVESRLNPVAREHGLDSISELAETLRKPNQRKLAEAVVDAMTTNETSFYRDIHPFDLLRTKLLPELIEKRSNEKRLTIWSNACSSGQEIYSIAMMIREHFPQLAGWDVRLRATDLSSEILERAENGIFNQTEVNRGLPMQLLMKYFHRDGVHWRINDDIRSMVRFDSVNLIENWPLTLMSVDVVFLRNVLIYFTPDTKREILAKVRQRIREDGILFLGGSENTMNLTDEFERTQVDRTVYYRPV
ncbi:protein-glutamate O-methyltransferase CheR [Rhodopirellula sp. JC740]|uniref:protein-glutamate O-methyltransferase n=1 Tax=Rhodopirellula halodulae TaxID=2894198 RepID=A0ABS8NI44_9BACT|nr:MULTISPECIES: protein-glutamate O-methyltransferase CheR [unclassified Rhodopirellula]MCC9643234.1 protein-glutamate O-methyltransferase CheR [Rhodopirellula sp. JC740]MCC9655036.1 protein-glutamate O-methyltransferase CheR [Rhodopirellula sp. JC737]